ncbi:hypothetical protein BCR32DRAFT_288744 [Anaeromyces robustus]|uniref:Uncharacterized protein n=1 Tax=Anaeromyces robustus TaxID=1754192 RepID=A0A1Y1XR37_9FUNG|nr:hypothetical protein BCR32DRAFT_288744 [Anaeromyces robustus]|eukprot:ORX88231.1 hypothetical protein BCR32DRAFT_288744 [Anaeromyces robustus]
MGKYIYLQNLLNFTCDSSHGVYGYSQIESTFCVFIYIWISLTPQSLAATNASIKPLPPIKSLIDSKRDSLKIEFRAGQRILCQHGNVLRTVVINIRLKLRVKGLEETRDVKTSELIHELSRVRKTKEDISPQKYHRYLVHIFTSKPNYLLQNN